MSLPPRLALAACLVLLPLAATAESDAPPNRPRGPYQGVFEVEFHGEVAPGEEPLDFEDTLTVAISGQRLVQESRVGNPKVTLVDLARNEVLEFDPEDPEKSVARLTPDDLPPVFFLLGSAVFEDLGAPQPVGNEQVAGKSCTLVSYGDPETEGALACVTSDGIVARVRLRLPGFERTWIATRLEPGPVPDGRFELPKGFRAPSTE